MQSIRQIQRLNDAELEKCIPPNASWHTDYRDTAYIYIGGLPFELSEGDVLTIFSQYGNPVHINLMRDKETGKSRGFAFLKYEDQKSCDLAVDNLSGAGVLGRVLTVDHTRYKLKEGEVEGQGLEDDGPDADSDETDREGNDRRKRRRTSSGDEARRPMIKEEMELAKLLKEHDDDDPMKAYLIKEKKEEVAEALKRLSVRSDEKRTHRKSRPSHRSRDADDDPEVSRHRHRRPRGTEDRDRRGEKDETNARRRSRSRDERVETSTRHRSHRSDKRDGENSRRDGEAKSPVQSHRRRRKRSEEAVDSASDGEAHARRLDRKADARHSSRDRRRRSRS